MVPRQTSRRAPGVRVCLALHSATGGLLLAIALAIRLFHQSHPILAALEPIGFALGLIVLLLAVFPARGIHPTLFAGGCVSVLISVLALGTAETVCRVMGIDFLAQEANWLKLPPYCRQPKVPSGTVFFRHRGPEVWTGQVLTTGIGLAGWPVPEAYRNEPVLTVRYDATGFRNEDELTDWEVAVAGDSFTELGSVPFDALFTTILGRETGVRVRNLGVSSTGPFTHLSYLEDYGVAPSLKHVVIVFFEGNDMDDLGKEYNALTRYEETGERPYRWFEKQTSLLTALGDLWIRSSRREPLSLDLIPVVHFHSAQGVIPVTITQVPPAVEHLTPGDHAELKRFFSEYRAFGQRRGVRTWLAYMPCKGRVLHGRVEAVEAHREGGGLWIPTRFPEVIAEGCMRHGIEFIDLTPPLRRAAQERGELVYNSMIDVHLNAKGSMLVGETLVRRLKPELQTDTLPPSPPP